MSNKSKTYFINISTSLLLQILTLLSGFIVPRLVIISYGSDANGLIGVITQLVSVLSIFEAGLGTVSVISLYKPLNDRDETLIYRTLHSIELLYHRTGVRVVVALVILSLFSICFFDVSFISSVEIGILVFAIGTANIVDYFFTAKFRAVLIADNKSFYVSLATSLQVIISLLIYLSLASANLSLLYFKMLTSSALIIKPIIIFFIAYRKYGRNLNSVSAVPIPSQSDAIYQQGLSLVQNSGTSLLLSTFSTLAGYSVFLVYNMIAVGMSAVIASLSSGVNTIFGRLLSASNKDINRIYDIFQTFFFIILTTLFSSAMILTLPFIKIYTKDFSDTNYNDYLLSLLVLINAVLFNVKTPQGTLILAAGLFKETKKQNTIQALILLLGGLVLGMQYGSYGVIIASILSNVYRIVDLYFFSSVFFKQINALKSLGYIVLTVFAFSLAAIVSIHLEIEISSWLSFLLVGVVTTISVAILVIIIFTVLYYNDIRVLLSVVLGSIKSSLTGGKN